MEDREAADTTPAVVGSLIPAHATAELDTFVNSREGLPEKKRNHFVDFSFAYPASWQIEEDGSLRASPNFVKLGHRTDDDFTLENFAVSWYSEMEPEEALEKHERRASSVLENYERLGDVTATIDGRPVSGVSFGSLVPDTNRGPTRFWGRFYVVPTDTTSGILLVMFASELHPEIDGPEDVGARGSLPIVLRSFELGESR